MSHASSLSGLATAALGLLLVALALPAQAQVHKCTQADGSVVFQAAPCLDEAPRADRVTAAQLNAAQRARERARARAAAASASSASGAGTHAHARAAGASKARPGK